MTNKLIISQVEYLKRSYWLKHHVWWLSSFIWQHGYILQKTSLPIQTLEQPVMWTVIVCFLLAKQVLSSHLFIWQKGEELLLHPPRLVNILYLWLSITDKSEVWRTRSLSMGACGWLTSTSIHISMLVQLLLACYDKQTWLTWKTATELQKHTLQNTPRKSFWCQAANVFIYSHLFVRMFKRLEKKAAKRSSLLCQLDKHYMSIFDYECRIKLVNSLGWIMDYKLISLALL